MRKNVYSTLSLAIAAALLGACSANGISKSPGTNQANLASNTLQFAVGTANIGQDGTVGLNFVSTLRQPNGLTGVLASNQTITGPSPGFLVPAGAAGAYTGFGADLDAGTNHISSSPQVPQNNAGLVNTTLGTFTGDFSYGLGPYNSDQSIVNGGYYPGQPNSSGGNGFTSSNYDPSSLITGLSGGGEATQPVPFFSATPMEYIIGPPANGIPFFNDGTWPVNFAGYSPGIAPVEIAPVAGAYTMSVTAAAQNAAPFTYTQTATLASLVALPAMAAPTFVVDGTGGGSGSVTAPARVTETLVFVADGEAGLFYAMGPFAGPGAHAFTLPDNLGKCSIGGANCQNTANAGLSITSGHHCFISAIGFDYPAFEAGPPNNVQQNPVITGSNGQADITMSPVLVNASCSAGGSFVKARSHGRFHRH